MPTSFVVGAKKVLAGTEPRIVVLAGNEPALKDRLLKELTSRDIQLGNPCGTYHHAILDVFTAPLRQSKTKLVVVENADAIPNWDWLIVFLAKVKTTRLVLVVRDDRIAHTLEARLNTRGLVIDCSAPTTQGQQSRLVTMLAEWYGFSSSQLNLLLNKNGWRVTDCVQLLDKLKLLNMPLNSDTMMMLGLSQNPQHEFIDAMQNGETSKALTIIPRLGLEERYHIVVELSRWLDRLARVKFAQAFMKPVHEVALEVGEDRKTVEALQKQGRRYDLGKINRVSLMLALAEKDFSRGYSDGVLEVMVNNW